MDIVEVERDEMKQRMEEVLASLEQQGEGKHYGKKCDKDSMLAINVLREAGLIKVGVIRRIDGPLYHYNKALGGEVKAPHHSVAELERSWIADIAFPANERVFYDFEDYLQRSGIRKA